MAQQLRKLNDEERSREAREFVRSVKVGEPDDARAGKPR
jgi:hypothetical protein